MARPLSPAALELKAQIWAELRQGRQISEAYINGDTASERVYGLSEAQRVVVNPAPHVLDTLVHELLHRIHPRWGERRVVHEARRIVITMTDAEQRRWYRQYERVRRIQRKPIESDVER